MYCVYTYDTKVRYSLARCKKYNTHEFYAVNENEIYLYSYGPSEKTLWFKVYHYGIQPIVHDIELVKLLDARRRKLMDDTKPARIVELPSVVMLMNKLMPNELSMIVREYYIAAHPGFASAPVLSHSAMLEKFNININVDNMELQYVQNSAERYKGIIIDGVQCRCIYNGHYWRRVGENKPLHFLYTIILDNRRREFLHIKDKPRFLWPTA